MWNRVSDTMFHKVIAGALSVSITLTWVLPYPAFALRPEPVNEASGGLEELREALGGGGQGRQSGRLAEERSVSRREFVRLATAGATLLAAPHLAHPRAPATDSPTLQEQAVSFLLSMQVKTGPRAGLLKSYDEIPHSDSLAPYIKDRAYTSDQAKAVVALVASGKIEEARRILQTLASVEAGSGRLGLSYRLGHVGEENPTLSSGVLAWVGSAILLYEGKTGDQTFRPMAQRVASTLLSLRDPVTRLVKGGRRSGGTALAWIATEHNVDAYFFLRDLGRLTKHARYRQAASEIEQGILTTLFHQDHFGRGFNDPTDMLEANSSGALFLLAIGKKEEAKAVRAYIEKTFKRAITLEGKPLVGYAPYQGDEIVWTEGSFGVALLDRRLGDAPSADTIAEAMERLRAPSGGIRYAYPRVRTKTPDDDSTYSTFPSVAATARFLIQSLNPKNFWTPSEAGLEEGTEALIQELRHWGLGAAVDVLRELTHDRPEEFSLALPVAAREIMLLWRHGTDADKFTHEYLPMLVHNPSSIWDVPPVRTAADLVAAIELAQFLSAHGVDPGLAYAILRRWFSEIRNLTDQTLSADPGGRETAIRALNARIASLEIPPRHRDTLLKSMNSYLLVLMGRTSQRRAERHFDATGQEIPWDSSGTPGRAGAHHAGDPIYLSWPDLKRRLHLMQSLGLSLPEAESALSHLEDLIWEAELVPDVTAQKVKAIVPAAQTWGDDLYTLTGENQAQVTDRWVHWLYRRAHGELLTLSEQVHQAEIAAFREGRMAIEQLPVETVWALVSRDLLRVEALPWGVRQASVILMLTELKKETNDLRAADFSVPLTALRGQALRPLFLVYQHASPTESQDEVTQRIRQELFPGWDWEKHAGLEEMDELIAVTPRPFERMQKALARYGSNGSAEAFQTALAFAQAIRDQHLGVPPADAEVLRAAYQRWAWSFHVPLVAGVASWLVGWALLPSFLGFVGGLVALVGVTELSRILYVRSPVGLEVLRRVAPRAYPSLRAARYVEQQHQLMDTWADWVTAAARKSNDPGELTWELTRMAQKRFDLPTTGRPFLNQLERHFWPEFLPGRLSRSQVFLPMRGDEPDEVAMMVKLIRHLNDQGIEPVVTDGSPSHGVSETLATGGRGLGLRYRLLHQQADRLVDPVHGQEFQQGHRGRWTPIVVESLSRRTGARIPAEDLAGPLRYTASDRPPLVMAVHGFSDFQQAVPPAQIPAEVVDLFQEWRRADRFVPSDRKLLVGFLYDSALLEMAGSLATQDRTARWQFVRDILAQEGVASPKDLPDSAIHVWVETPPRSGPQEIDPLLDVLARAHGGASRPVVLWTSAPPPPEDRVAQPRPQGCTVVPLPASLSLTARRRLLVAMDVAVVGSEQFLADALYLARTKTDHFPLLLYAPWNMGRFAALSGPLTATGRIDTLRDLYAFNDIRAGRASEEAVQRLRTLMSDLTLRRRYLEDLGETIFANAQEKNNGLLVNGLNVMSRIAFRYDRGWPLGRILRSPGSEGAHPAYLAPRDRSVEQVSADDGPWRVFVDARRRAGLDPAARILHRYQRGDPLDDPRLQDTLDLATREWVQSAASLAPLEVLKTKAEGPVLSPVGKGGSFVAVGIPDTDVVLKYRYLHDEPFTDLGYPFEAEDRYVHIHNTIRALGRIGDFGVPSAVFVTRDLLTRHSELTRYAARGWVQVVEEPWRVRVSLYRRDGDEAHREVHTVSVSTGILQQRVEPLEDRVRALMRENRVDDAGRLLDQYFALIHQLWRHGVYLADLHLGTVGFEPSTGALKVFDLGTMPPLEPDAFVPDAERLDYPRSVPDDLRYVREFVQRQLTYRPERDGRNPALEQQYGVLRQSYLDRAGSEFTTERFIELWGTARDAGLEEPRTTLERRQLVAINRFFMEERLGAEQQPLRLAAARQLRLVEPYEAVYEPSRVEVDLQLHTLHSDGYATPTAVVYEAYRRGLKAIALTDHYSVDGVLEALEAGRIFGVEVLPAVEVDTDLDGVELLGYFPDLEQFQTMLAQPEQWAWIAAMRKAQEERAEEVRQRLSVLLPTMPLSREELQAAARGGPVLIGTVHQVFRRKYGRRIADLLQERGTSWNEIRGEPDLAGISPQEVLSKLAAMGGVPVLAHPAKVLERQGWDMGTFAGALAQWSAAGLKGVEVNSSHNRPGQTQAFLQMVSEHNRAHPDHPLLTTVGSDSHGTLSPDRVMGRGLVTELGRYEIVEALRAVSAGRAVPAAIPAFEGLLAEARSALSTSGRRPLRVMSILGTRAEISKQAPLVQAFRADPKLFDHRWVLVGQQPEAVLRPFLDAFDLPWFDHVIPTGGALTDEAHSRVQQALELLMDEEEPDLILVQGDTAAAYRGALAAHHYRRRHPQTLLVHLEAGLRTWDLQSPFPEEGYRAEIGHVAQIHLAPTLLARANLEHEGVDPRTIAVTGQSLIDALGYATRKSSSLPVEIPEGSKLVVVTFHRTENRGLPMARIGEALTRLAKAHPELFILLPMHITGRSREAALHLEEVPNLRVVEPLPYGQMLTAIQRAWLILTDSGGLQEDAPYFGVPVLVLRDKTERPEAILAGTARLVGTQTDEIVEAVETLLADPGLYDRMTTAINPFGDGRATERALQTVLFRLGLVTRPAPSWSSPIDSIVERLIRSSGLQRLPVQENPFWRDARKTTVGLEEEHVFVPDRRMIRYARKQHRPYLVAIRQAFEGKDGWRITMLIRRRLAFLQGPKEDLVLIGAGFKPEYLTPEIVEQLTKAIAAGENSLVRFVYGSYVSAISQERSDQLNKIDQILTPIVRGLGRHIGGVRLFEDPLAAGLEEAQVANQRVLIVTPDGLPKLSAAAVLAAGSDLQIEVIARDEAHQHRVASGLEELGITNAQVHNLQVEFHGDLRDAVMSLQLKHWQEGRHPLVVTAMSGLEEMATFLGAALPESDVRNLEAVVQRSQSVWM